MSLSKPKSLFYSLFIAPFRKYNEGRFDEDYFSNYPTGPGTKWAEIFQKYFEPKNSLDAGCGVGGLVWGLKNLGVDAYGVDVSPQAIEKASPEIRSRLSVGNLVQLNYPDNEFDLVTCVEVLEHIPFPECEQVIENLYRITGKGLLFTICLWADGNARKDPTHINLHSKRWWARYFKKKGYRLVPTPDHFPSRRSAYIIQKT